MEVILIVGVLIAIGLAFVSAMIASGKGRSGLGWFVLIPCVCRRDEKML